MRPKRPENVWEKFRKMPKMSNILVRSDRIRYQFDKVRGAGVLVHSDTVQSWHNAKSYNYEGTIKPEIQRTIIYYYII